MRIIDKKLLAITCAIYLVYFTGISIYTLIPELFDINESYKFIFYWVNNTLMTTTSTFIFSKFVVNKRISTLIKGVSVFLLVLGVFQITKTLGYIINRNIWLSICPLYIIFNLVVFRLCHQKKRCKNLG